MKIIYACAAALTLLAGGALAAGAPPRTPTLAPALAPPLAPAKAAGVSKAQDADTMTGIYVIAGGALVAGIAILASDDDNAATTATATST